MKSANVVSWCHLGLSHKRVGHVSVTTWFKFSLLRVGVLFLLKYGNRSLLAFNSHQLRLVKAKS